jgi:predicted nucleic acid-binding Zn finger protein
LSEVSVHAEQASRALRGLRLFRERGVEIRPIKDGFWRVPSSSVLGRYYAVSLERESCTCADYGRRRKPCKHVYAVVAAAARRGRQRPALRRCEHEGAA